MKNLRPYFNPLYVFRLAAVGIAFAIVSLGVLPVFILRAGDHRNNRVFCRAINFFLVRILGIRLVVDKTAAVYDDRSAVVVVNHQGVMDVISCGPVLPKRSSTLAKRSLGMIPVWGRIFRLGGNILVDRGDKGARAGAMRALNAVIAKDKASLFIFPEGTRNPSNQIRRFHDGAFRCALRNKTCVQPVVISTYAGNVTLRRWRAGTIAVKVLSPVELNVESEATITDVIERIKTQMQVEIDLLDRQIAACV